MQGVGDALNLAAIIIKSYPNFVDFSFIEATNSELQLLGMLMKCVMHQLRN